MEGDQLSQFDKREKNCSLKRRHDDKAHDDDRRGPRTQQHRRKRRINDSKSRNFTANASNCDLQKKVTCSVCNVDNPKYKCPKCRSTYCSIDCCRKHKEAFCSIGSCSITEASKEEKQGDAVADNIIQIYPSSKYLTKLELAQMQDENKVDLNNLQKKLQDDVMVDEDLPPGWKMTKDMVKMMRKSKWLRDEVADSGLQQLIVKIVSSSRNVANVNRFGYSKSSQQFSTNVTTYREQMLSDIKSQFPQFQMFVDKLLYLTGVYERCDRTKNNLNVTIDDCLSNENHATFSLKPLPQRVRLGSTSLIEHCQASRTGSESMSTGSESDERHENDDETEDSDSSNI